jgi:hypothetical protein
MTPEEQSEWNAPINLVKKGDTYRLCMDFTALNKEIENDAFPLPRVMPTLQHLAQYKFFGKIDLKNGYWNIKAGSKEVRVLLAFKGPDGTRYIWLVLPQGLKVSPSIFQRKMEEMFGHLPCKIYIDDFCFGANTLTELDAKEATILEALEEAGFVINEGKGARRQTSIKMLGHVVSHLKVEPDNDKIREVVEFGPIHTEKALRSYLGKIGYIAMYYPGLKKHTGALAGLLKSKGKKVKKGKKEPPVPIEWRR